jgi:4-hydroxy-tetrahydrodipicolinate reductase
MYAFDVSSSRIGTVVGEHTVRFDGPDDQIVLHHSARSRRGFAVGALEAAKWLSGKTGFFTLDDMLDEWVC